MRSAFLPNPILLFPTQNWHPDSSLDHRERRQLLRRLHRKPLVETLQARAPRRRERICRTRAWRMGPEPNSKRVMGMPEWRALNPRRAQARGRDLALARPMLRLRETKAFRGSQSQVACQDAAGERARQVQSHMVLTPLP